MSAISRTGLKYFDAYSINLKFKDRVLSELQNADLPEDFKHAIRYGIEGKRFQEQIAQTQAVFNSTSFVLSMMPPEAKTPANPGYIIMTEMIERNNRSERDARSALEAYKGVDPYAIQSVVNTILGIQKDCVVSGKLGLQEGEQFLSMENMAKLTGLTIEQKKQCYDFLKGTQFLESNQEWFSENGGVKEAKGSEFLAQYLKENPDTKKLILGCGVSGELYPGSCFERIPDHNLDNSVTLSLDAIDGSDVIGDMHDPELLQVVPDNYFERIEDHTKGPFLFNNNDGNPRVDVIALQALFRTLKPGGSLILETHQGAQEQEHLEKLQKVGFIVQSCESSGMVTATKPN